LLLEWTWESLAAQIPFVYPPHHCTGRWKSRLPASGKLKIGLNWSGHPLWQLDKNRYRSVQLRELAPIARIPEVELYSLQFGEGVEQLADAPFRISDLKVGDFLDTAAAVQALDLIITVDSALVHVAGALGKRCLVMLPFISCWRWMLDRSDCPQYPSLRLFRQRVGGDWSKPIAEIAAVTAALAGRHNEHSLAEPSHES
jgi:hypothetical protein